METPLVIVHAVGPPTWERIGGDLVGWGCGGPDEHAFAFEGALEGGADPGAGVDVAFGAQTSEGVVDVGRGAGAGVLYFI